MKWVCVRDACPEHSPARQYQGIHPSDVFQLNAHTRIVDNIRLARSNHLCPTFRGQLRSAEQRVSR